LRTSSTSCHGFAQYRHFGAVVVWVADPINRNVVEYHQGVTQRTYAEHDTLTVPVRT
jgi:hypothetical protein